MAQFCVCYHFAGEIYRTVATPAAVPTAMWLRLPPYAVFEVGTFLDLRCGDFSGQRCGDISGQCWEHKRNIGGPTSTCDIFAQKCTQVIFVQAKMFFGRGQFCYNFLTVVVVSTYSQIHLKLYPNTFR